MVMMIVLHDLSSFHYVAVLSRNKVEEDLIVIVVRNTIIEKAPPSVHPTPLQTHTTVAAYIIGGDSMWRWVTIYAVKPEIYFFAGVNICRTIYARRQNMPQHGLQAGDDGRQRRAVRGGSRLTRDGFGWAAHRLASFVHRLGPRQD